MGDPAFATARHVEQLLDQPIHGTPAYRGSDRPGFAELLARARSSAARFDASMKRLTDQ